MSTRKNLIEREVFEKMISETRCVDRTSYQDIDTIYGDMSRLVVAWLSRTSTAELDALHNQLGWNGDANVRAIQEAAKTWFARYRPNA